MLGDLILVFICSIIFGTMLMFLRLWRERQMLRRQYTQIPSADPFDFMERGKGHNEPSRYGSGEGGRAGAASRRLLSSPKRQSPQREKRLDRNSRKRLQREIDSKQMFGFGGASASARKKVASPAAALAAAAVKAATFCRNSIFYKWIDIPLVQWGKGRRSSFF